jgi:FkbM family methyltransferase
VGNFAAEVWSVFGAATPPPRVLMFEAAQYHSPGLLARGFDFVIAVLGSQTSWANFYEHAKSHDGNTGNSVLQEQSVTFESITPRRAVLRRVDDLLEDLLGAGAPQTGLRASVRTPLLDGPALIKLDVQGYEIEVLKGATRALESAELVLLETSVLQYNKGSPLVIEVLTFMGTLGFEVFDLVETHQSHGQLIQLDFTFVRKSSALFQNAMAAAQLAT